MKTSEKSFLLTFVVALAILLGMLTMMPMTASAAGGVRVDFCLTNGALENNVFFENDPSKYFLSQYTNNDGKLLYLEELYRTDSLDLEFDGWYTEQGEKVTTETVFTEYTILFDRWEETSRTDSDMIADLSIGTPLLEVGKTVANYDESSITLVDDRLEVAKVEVYEGLNAYRTNKLNNGYRLEAGKSYSLRVELHTKNGELIDDQLMHHSTATYGLVANMLYSHDNSGIFTTQWTNRENKIQVIINYDYENYYFTSDLEDKVVENGQSPQYTVYVSNNANVKSMELFIANPNGTWASLGAVAGQFNIPANSNVVKQYRVEVTYQNGFVISSNTFEVDWYDPNAPQFTTQPMDYDVAYGTNVVVSWGLNFDVSSIQLEKYDGEAWNYFKIATPTGVTIEANAESGTYWFRAHATKDSDNILSEEFTITWHDKLEFTTQPQSMTVATGEEYTITWATNQTPSVLQVWSDDGNGNYARSFNINDTNSTSYTFSASHYPYSKNYKLMANYDSMVYFSDIFTIEIVAGEFTVQPQNSNAIVGKDLLVEWDFNLEADYYDILWYDGTDFTQYDRVYIPEHVFNENTEGAMQFLIEAYNANNVEIGQSEVFTITWAEEQIVYLVSFNANNGTGTMQPVEQNAGSQYTLPACTFTAPEDKVFKAWDVNGVEKKAGDSITITANTIIKAIWEEIPTFFVVYAPGDGNGSNDLDYIEEGATITLLAPADLGFTAQEGMTFSHWKVCKDNASDPNAVVKQPGDVITITFETYIIAIWEEIPVNEYMVAYSSNGGAGTMVGDVVEENGTFTLDACTYTAPQGKQFKGWAVGSVDATPLKQAGDQIIITADTIVYAIWEDVPAQHEHNHGTAWVKDASEHWNECACGDKANKASHADSNTDGTCDVCGWIDPNFTPITPDPEGGNQDPVTPPSGSGQAQPEPAPEAPETPDAEGEAGLSGGAIAGIAVGAAAVVAIGGFAIFWFVIKKKSIQDLIKIFKK